MSESLESQIKKAQSTARGKMTRISKREGIHLASTPFNPIRSTEGLTYSQRRTYLNQLKRFNSKETNFFRDGRQGGGFITAKDWKKYKEAEKAANKAVEADINKYGKIKAWNPGVGDGGMTLKERYDYMKPKVGRFMHNPSGSGMHEVDRNPTAINGPASLARLTEQQAEKATPQYKKRKIKQGREQAGQMLNALDKDDMLADINNLTDEQFHILWNYTDFANTNAIPYELMKLQLERGASEHHAGILNSSFSKMRGLIDWASKI